MHAPRIVDLILDRSIALPSGERVDRGGFFEWLWADCGDDLVGVDEGAVDVDEAAAFGLVATPRVLDAAAAPGDRDWVAAAPTGAAACWFATAEAAAHTAERLADLAGCRVRGVRRVEADDDRDWRQAFTPIVVPGFGTICPAWHDGEAATTAAGVWMFIEPGVGFGTGLHETTQLCLQSLADWRATGGRFDRVLDFGSGSGILGIAAALLGAGHVDAVEIDATVHAAIRSNAARNGVIERIHVAPALPEPNQPFDVVVANIVAPVLLECAADLCGRLRRSSPAAVVLSGLGADDVAAVSARYATALGAPPTETSAGEWRCLRFVAVRP